MGRGEISHYEQFLLFPLYFKRLVLQTHKNKGLFGKVLKPTLIKIKNSVKNTNKKLENILGKGEKPGCQCFSIFPCFQRLSCLRVMECMVQVLFFPKKQILDSSKQKEFADDNFKFYKNGRKFS